jgi:hypothetical protein
MAPRPPSGDAEPPPAASADGGDAGQQPAERVAQSDGGAGGDSGGVGDGAGSAAAAGAAAPAEAQPQARGDDAPAPGAQPAAPGPVQELFLFLERVPEELHGCRWSRRRG